MLLNFEFENYKSYRENNVINMNGENSCLIVGEELSGKTNAIEALICCISHIISPIQFIHREEIKIYKKCIPFFYGALDESDCTKFKIEVELNKDIYKYSINIKNNQNMISIEAESLTINEIKMYDREKEKIELCNDFINLSYLTSVDSSMPYISYLSVTEKNERIERLINYLKEIICIDTSLNSYISNDYTQKCLLDNKTLILKILKSVDKNFKDYYLRGDKSIISIYHIDSQDVEIDVKDDSATIQQIFVFLPQILDSIRKGNLIVIDDIDKKINKKTLKNIISIFKDDKVNRKKSQLIASITKYNDVKTIENNIIFTIKEKDLKTRFTNLIGE